MEENTTEEPVAQTAPLPEAAQPAPVAEQSATEPEVDKAPEDDEQADESELPEKPWVTDAELPTRYNWAWRAVIKSLMDRKPAYQAYAEAYDIDINTESGRRQAEANSTRLMRNDKFRALWRKILIDIGFNNETVDNELVKLINDPDTPHQVRRAAIRDFNELHGRIITKIDHTNKGKEFKAPMIISNIDARNAGTETETTDGN